MTEQVAKPSNSQIAALGSMLGHKEMLSPSGLTDLPADYHYEKLDELCGGDYYAFGDEEGSRMMGVFQKAFRGALSSD